MYFNCICIEPLSATGFLAAEAEAALPGHSTERGRSAAMPRQRPGGGPTRGLEDDMNGVSFVRV